MLNRRGFMYGAATSVGVATAMAAEPVKAAAEATMSLNVIYPNSPGARFDTKYYRSTHIPLAMRVMKATNVVLIEGVANGDAAAPFAMIAHFQFSSGEALKSALASPGMADVRADVSNFTDIKPTVMLGRSP